jgi:hypothetical protein
MTQWLLQHQPEATELLISTCKGIEEMPSICF